MAYSELTQAARDYYALCDEAESLGIPVSLDYPDSPETIQSLRDAIQDAYDALPDPEASYALRDQTR